MIIKDYFRDDDKREQLNTLTRETFGFDFNDWYNKKYYTGEYIPYSVEVDGRIVSNASANIMKFDITENNANVDDDSPIFKRMYIQIGTVMTAKEYRKKGYARQLINMIIDEYKDKCDGIYLFGNLSALDFYDELGFYRCNQYKVSMNENVIIRDKLNEKNDPDFKAIIGNKELEKIYVDTVKNTVNNSSFEQNNKFGLQMFYTGNFDNVWYSPSLDCFISYECNDKELYLKSIIANHSVCVEKILKKVPDEFNKVYLEFTPKGDLSKYEFTKFDGGDDYRLFCLGDEMRETLERKLYFPEFSHA